jgi:membrane peptidoglycan carboxypeptidase
VLPADLLWLPSVDAVASQTIPSDTLIYDRTGGVLLADLHAPGVRHYERRLSDLGRYLPAATVAVEDRNFWKEAGGVDPLGAVRAGAFDLVAGAPVQGGSTITQQLIKLRLLGNDTSVARKLREAILAVRVSEAYTKPRVLEMYLNAIYYGNDAYGAEAAARAYFHVEAAQLDLAQASMLAGLPQQPTLLNPLTHWEAAKQRQRDVLDAMVRSGDVTPIEADQADAEDLSPPDHLYATSTPNLAPGFVETVKSELAEKLGKDVFKRGGLTVLTTLDWGLQQRAQAAVTDAVQTNRSLDVSDGALVSIDPRNGEILAMVGSAGPDVPGGQYNLAVWPPRNPGSTFKLFTYTAAVASRRYTMVTPIEDAPLTVYTPGASPYAPLNYDGAFHGTCELQACFADSFNIPAVKVEMDIGIPKVVAQARRMGAPPYQRHGDRYTTEDPASSFGPSLTVGGYGETPLQMATAASLLAAGGVLHRPGAVRTVSGPAGEPASMAGPGGASRVVDAGTAFIISQMLEITVAGRRVAAKTGTTDDFTDSWLVGYTPSLATALWMGNADAHGMAGGTGAALAAPTWRRFMTEGLDLLGRGDEWPAPPSDLSTRTIDGKTVYFLPGTS